MGGSGIEWAQLGLSIRAVVNYEKDRSPTARALAQLEQLASDNDHPELGRIFRDALGNELGFGMSNRPPLSGDELYLDRAFRRCVLRTRGLRLRRKFVDCCRTTLCSSRRKMNIRRGSLISDESLGDGAPQLRAPGPQHFREQAQLNAGRNPTENTFIGAAGLSQQGGATPEAADMVVNEVGTASGRSG